MDKSICGARTRKGIPCQRTGLKKGGRCKLHGGKSTGPKDKERKSQQMKGNKNALKTGEYESIAFDALSEEEQELIQSVTDDPKKLVKSNIGILEIRQRRMLLRYREEIQKKNPSEKDLNSLEEALTRLSGRELEYIRELRDLSAETTDNDNGSLGTLVDILAEVRKHRIGS